jgi:hypothetical protein
MQANSTKACITHLLLLVGMAKKPGGSQAVNMQHHAAEQKQTQLTAGQAWTGSCLVGSTQLPDASGFLLKSTLYRFCYELPATAKSAYSFRCSWMQQKHSLLDSVSCEKQDAASPG